jgi:hypothetical protein
MLVGIPPFAASDSDDVHSQILADRPLDIPEPSILSAAADDLLRELLRKSPSERLGATGGAISIKEHRFFQGIDWNRLQQREYTPSFKPSTQCPTLSFEKQEHWTKMRDIFPGYDPVETMRHLSEIERPPSPVHAISSFQFETSIYDRPTYRILQTQLLSHAVDRHDITVIQKLLVEGARPDFPSEEAGGHLPDDVGCHVGWASWGQENDYSVECDKFVPPLVRAIRCKNLDIARMLLDAGADPNVGYHRYPHYTSACGRVIWLAMETKDERLVDLLLDFGADVELAQPEMKGHRCWPFIRWRWAALLVELKKAKARRLCLAYYDRHLST